jgi:hypothetical protein
MGMILYGTSFLYRSQSSPYLTQVEAQMSHGSRQQVEDSLVGALFVISHLTMDQEHSKEHEVKVGDRGLEASW